MIACYGFSLPTSNRPRITPWRNSATSRGRASSYARPRQGQSRRLVCRNGRRGSIKAKQWSEGIAALAGRPFTLKMNPHVDPVGFLTR